MKDALGILAIIPLVIGYALSTPVGLIYWIIEEHFWHALGSCVIPFYGIVSVLLDVLI
jgi:hypothetical protein